MTSRAIENKRGSYRKDRTPKVDHGWGIEGGGEGGEGGQSLEREYG